MTLVLLCTTRVSTAAQIAQLKVTVKEGRKYVSSRDLAEIAGIAVKSLPRQKGVVACTEDRCAVVEDFFASGSHVLVRVDSLAGALGLQAQFGSAGETVMFTLLPRVESQHDALPKVGQLAPDFRLVKLDGTPVSLSDFRGKRVLINSWASW